MVIVAEEIEHQDAVVKSQTSSTNAYVSSKNMDGSGHPNTWDMAIMGINMIDPMAPQLLSFPELLLSCHRCSFK